MPMNERRRLANEAKVIVAETRRTSDELKKCVARSRALVAESKLLLALSRTAATCPHIRKLDRPARSPTIPADGKANRDGPTVFWIFSAG
jgi:hypothetical protein